MCFVYFYKLYCKVVLASRLAEGGQGVPALDCLSSSKAYLCVYIFFFWVELKRGVVEVKVRKVGRGVMNRQMGGV